MSARIIWHSTNEEDGAIGYWGNVKGHKDLCFSVWINSVEAHKRQRLVDLCSWAGEGDDPDFQLTLKIPASRSMEWILEQVPGWQERLVQETVKVVEERAELVRSLL